MNGDDITIEAKQREQSQTKEDRTVLEDALEDDGDSNQQQTRVAASTLMVRLAKECATFFVDPSGGEYAVYEQDGHNEIWQIDSEEFSNWISHRFYLKEKKVASNSALKDAIRTLKGLARYDGDKDNAHMRVAQYEGGYLIDLCNDQWQVAFVRPGSVEVLDESPVKFYRSPNMAALPLPLDASDVDLIFEYVNVTDQTRNIYLATLVDWFRPESPYPILEIVGEHGSAKSGQQKCTVAIVDPSSVPLSGKPKSVDDLFVAAVNQHLFSMDNLSGLTNEMQDELCRLATGGGRKQRKLYTDSDIHALQIKRPVIMNGIEVLATRPDLIDRIVQIMVPPIDEYIPESVITKRFAADRPAIFSGLLQLFAESLKHIGSYDVPKDLRQQDYVALGQAVSKARGNEPDQFVQDYRQMRADALILAVESDLAVSALIGFIDATHDKQWAGPVGVLLQGLMNQQQAGSKDKDWPNPKAFSSSLARFGPALRLLGVKVEKDPVRKTDGYHVRISQI